MKTERNSLAKRIRGKRDIWDKFIVARGMPLHNDYAVPKTVLDTFAFVQHVRSWKRFDKAGKLGQQLMGIGTFIGSLVLDRDYRFFARLANILQCDRKPTNYSKLYLETLWFCVHENAGTRQRPCDPRRLLEHLSRHGFRFPAVTQNGAVPTQLRRLCNKLGVVLVRGRPGPREFRTR